MIQSSIAMLIGTGIVGLTSYKRLFWVAAMVAMLTLYMATFQMVIWLATESTDDHSWYAKLLICRMTDKTGECP